jgi:hypothetical protein
MPVARVQRCESPLYASPAQPALNHPVVSHVKIVIINDEPVLPHGQVEQQSDQREQKAEKSWSRHRRLFARSEW